MKKTENKVQFKIYAGGVLGDETDMLRKMKIGQIQGVALSSAGLSSVFREIDVLQVPFLFQKYEEVDHVLGKMDVFSERGSRQRICPSGMVRRRIYLSHVYPAHLQRERPEKGEGVDSGGLQIAKAIFERPG